LVERRAIARAAAEHGAGFDLILNVGSCALPEVEEMLVEAERGAYAAALCPPPFYFGSPPVRGLVDFFGRVLGGSTVPVLLYHVPQVTGVPISDELLDRLGAHQMLAGIKDSTGDPSEMARLNPRFSGGGYFVGNDHLVSDCLRAGGGGSITAVASVAPSLVTSVDAQGNHQPRLNAIRQLLEEYDMGAAVKALLRHRGFGPYASRPPLVQLAAPQVEELVRRFEALMADNSA
jgi:dihydrodipicolinate synthase/N-acetylneuraminate lyase